jgi:Fur family peroxide stress response transcriptional regulator
VNKTNKDIQQQINRFKEDCRNLGVKLTHQRMEIFREVLRAERHPDAETVFRGVRRRMPTVSLDTVYRTLWWLKDIGLITTLGISRDRARFDANLTRHHHFVCTQCGLTRDFYSDAFDSLEPPDSVRSIGHAERVQVEIRGLCLKCAESGKPGAKKQRREEF